MKNVLKLSFLLTILTYTLTYSKENVVHKEKILCHNTFADQVYVSVYADEKPVHKLIQSGSYESIRYQGQIQKITFNFQLPAYPIMVIESEDIPEPLKMISILPSKKVLLS